MQPKILYMDVESTGLDPAKDRIVELAMVLRDEEAGTELDVLDTLVDPGVSIPAEASAVHGIRDRDVVDSPRFADLKDRVLGLLAACEVISGYSVSYDVRMLRSELARCGELPDFAGKRVRDAQHIFFHHEPRDLSAAVRYYCGRDLAGAHRAGADARAAMEVLRAQRERYGLDFDAPEVRAYAEAPLPLDSGGAFEWDGQGGVRLAFGKHKGKPIRPADKELMNYLSWMIGAGFNQDTKHVARALLKGRTPTPQSLPGLVRGL